MSTPKYVPRQWIIAKVWYGKNLHVVWRPIGDVSGVEALRHYSERHAAYLQHHYAVRIRTRLKTIRMTVKEYSTQIGQAHDRVERVLRGEVVMRLEDISMADAVLGGIAFSPEPMPELRVDQ